MERMTDKPKKARRRSRETTIAGLLDWWRETHQRAQAARQAAEELASIEAMLRAVAPAMLERVRTEAGLPAKAPEFTPPASLPVTPPGGTVIIGKSVCHGVGREEKRMTVLVDNGDGTTTPVEP
jgi:hypothetical protein